MQLKQWIKIILVTGSIMTLAACSSGRKPQDGAIDDANAAYSSNDEGQTSGAGDESSRFGDQQSSGASKRLASNRTYYFDFDSDAIHDSDKPAIAANAKKLASNQTQKALLQGYTDPRGSREYNIGLGERRARSVAAQMTQDGASPSQLRIVSYGAEKLASPGHTEADYQLDRRVVLDKTNS